MPDKNNVHTLHLAISALKSAVAVLKQATKANMDIVTEQKLIIEHHKQLVLRYRQFTLNLLEQLDGDAYEEYGKRFDELGDVDIPDGIDTDFETGAK